MPPKKKAGPEASLAVPFKAPYSARATKHPSRSRNLKQIMSALRQKRFHPDAATYVSVVAPPSLKPAKKYCDITGLEAKYTDPKTRLRYHSKAEYAVICALSPAEVANLLKIRGASVPGV